MFKIGELVSLGAEYYANLGAFSTGLVPLKQQEHYVYEVLNLLAVKHFELNFGVGEGLTGVSNTLIFKTILGYTWERDAVPRPAIPPMFARR